MERVILILCILCILWKSGYKTNLKCTEISTQHMHKISSYIRLFLKHYCCEDSLTALKECQNMQKGEYGHLLHIYSIACKGSSVCWWQEWIDLTEFIVVIVHCSNVIWAFDFFVVPNLSIFIPYVKISIYKVLEYKLQHFKHCCLWLCPGKYEPDGNVFFFQSRFLCKETWLYCHNSTKT